MKREKRREATRAGFEALRADGVTETEWLERLLADLAPPLPDGPLPRFDPERHPLLGEERVHRRAHWDTEGTRWPGPGTDWERRRLLVLRLTHHGFERPYPRGWALDAVSLAGALPPGHETLGPGGTFSTVRSVVRWFRCPVPGTGMEAFSRFCAEYWHFWLANHGRDEEDRTRQGLAAYYADHYPRGHSPWSPQWHKRTAVRAVLARYDPDTLASRIAMRELERSARR